MSRQDGFALEVRNLVAGYGKKSVVNDLSFELLQREILLVIGHNGSGKTTTLRNVFGLAKPFGGQVLYQDQDVTGWSPAKKVAAGMALVPQGHGIFPSLSVSENLELGASVRRGGGRRPERWDAVLSLFPILSERLRQRAGVLSGGQQQMLAIGIALMQDPHVLFLDEPSIGLAPNLVDRLMAAIIEVNRTLSIPILMVEQDVKRSLKIADRVIVLRTGVKIYDGPIAPLQNDVELLRLF